MLATIAAALLLLTLLIAWYRTARPLHAFYRDASGTWTRLDRSAVTVLVLVDPDARPAVPARPAARPRPAALSDWAA